MRAAFEHAGIDARLGQHAGGRAHVHRFAVVRGAGQRQLGVGELQPVGGVALDERQCLQALDRRAREHRPVDVAERDDDRAVGVDDGERALVLGLDRVAAPRLDQHRRGHGVSA